MSSACPSFLQICPNSSLHRRQFRIYSPPPIYHHLILFLLFKLSQERKRKRNDVQDYPNDNTTAFWREKVTLNDKL